MDMAPAAELVSQEGRSHPLKRLAAKGRISGADIQLYRAADELSGTLILGMVIFSPWALGTTQRWSIWCMNMGGYALGVLLVLKLVLRRIRGYTAPRWVERTEPEMPWLIPTLVLLTVLILGFCLVSAANARATFDDGTLTFIYRQSLAWLPHSLDSTATWFSFWVYLGLACFFWALRDWLLGKSAAEEVAGWHAAADDKVGSSRGAEREPTPQLPQRLRRLLWVLIISGGLLAFESILQRGLNSSKLLFLVKPRVHQTAEGQFGPYAYRSNAAQYFNLLWPVGFGFWWTLNRNRRNHHTVGHTLLAAAALMAAASIISTSRAGALISLGMAVACAGVFLGMECLSNHGRLGRSGRHCHARGINLRPFLVFLAGAMVLGILFGWDTLGPRMPEFKDGLVDREEMFAEVRPMARDYPWFGTGPGTFETVSQLYPHTKVLWAQLHNDWLETRITFGVVGSVMIAAALGCVFLRWFVRGGIRCGRRFVWLIWVAMAGCLLHARFDFPFQIHSTLLLFLTWCGLLSTLSRRPGMQS